MYSFKKNSRVTSSIYNIALSKPRVIAIIPARGGSKGLPRKNAKLLCGKPLVAYSIETAFKITAVDRVVVSTDDEEIATIARQYGPDVPMHRPDNLGGDHAQIRDVIKNVYLQLKRQGYTPDMSIILLPTHPFRKTILMNHLAKTGLENRRPVVTVRNVRDTVCMFLTCGKNPSQLINPGAKRYVRHYGLFSCNNPDFCSSPIIHELNDPISFIDIDYSEDFLLAEEVIKNNLFDFDH